MFGAPWHRLIARYKCASLCKCCPAMIATAWMIACLAGLFEDKWHLEQSYLCTEVSVCVNIDHGKALPIHASVKRQHLPSYNLQQARMYPERIAQPCGTQISRVIHHSQLSSKLNTAAMFSACFMQAIMPLSSSPVWYTHRNRLIRLTIRPLENATGSCMVHGGWLRRYVHEAAPAVIGQLRAFHWLPGQPIVCSAIQAI